MNRFQHYLRDRRQAKVTRLSAEIESISAEMGHLVPSYPKWTRLNERRVRLWWKRNDLYAKLTKES